MAEKKRGAQSVLLQNRPRVLSFASMAGPKEAEGPLADGFDLLEKNINALIGS